MTGGINEDEWHRVAAISASIRSRFIGARPETWVHGSYERMIPGTAVSFSMAAIPGGTFVMGSTANEEGSAPDERPPRRVALDAFWLQTHPVTWDEYLLFLFATTQDDELAGAGADGWTRPTKPYLDMTFGMGTEGYPALSMTQHAANKYAEWLSARTGEFYRLPTEAEWEYACRGGTATPYFFGTDSRELGDYAWYAENSEGRSHPVALKKPNGWGLYDVLGNVMEWTLDAYAAYEPQQHQPLRNPWVKPKSAYPMVARGGSWADSAERVRCAARAASDPFWKRQDPQFPKSIWYHTDAPWLGFRLLRPLNIPSPEEMYGYWNNGVEYDEE